MKLLKFGRGNAKLAKEILTFTLPSGYTCPGASWCLARADKVSGHIKDGPNQKFRCFSASSESRFKNVRTLAWHNFDLLKGCESETEIVQLILASLPVDAVLVRVHVGGDFYCDRYFRAWMMVAQNRPKTRFYAYTKSLNYWFTNFHLVPKNFSLTASEGSKFDSLIEGDRRFKTSKVVFTIEEAMVLGLSIDHDDSHAYGGEDNFALLIHGGQASGSAANKAVRALNGVGGYSRK